MHGRFKNNRGFTIVELLIVIVVIGILAAITIVAYSGIQDRARITKMTSDLRSFEKAVNLARVQSGTVLITITGSTGTAAPCVGKPAGTDLAALPKSDICWTTYASALDKISIASGANIRNLVDPWGRPYFIDENESEGGIADCTKDTLGAYPLPTAASWVPMAGTEIRVANSVPTC